MFKFLLCFRLLWLSLTLPTGTLLSRASTALVPLNTSHCPLLQNVLNTVIYPADSCVFLVLDYVDCPLHLQENTAVVVGLEQLFSGFVSQTQRRFYCDKTFAMFNTWNTLRQFMAGRRSLAKQFEPYTRLGFFSQSEQNAHNHIFRGEHLNQIYFGALHVYFGRFTTANDFELEDVLTKKVIEFRNNTQLESAIRTTRNLLLHPLFDVSGEMRHEVNVSLYHCDPFVVQLNGEKTLKR